VSEVDEFEEKVTIRPTTKIKKANLGSEKHKDILD
jgi:hypothetical protein